MRRRLLLAGAALALLMGLALAGMVGTEAGLRWVLARAAGAVPGELVLEGVRGRLLGPVGVARLAYRDGETRVEAEQVRLRWRPAALLHGVLRVTELSAGRLRVHAGAGADGGPSQGLPQIALPLALRLDSLAVATLRVSGAGEAETVIEQVRAEGLRLDRRLQVKALSLRAAGVALQAGGWAQLAGDWPLELRLNAAGALGAWPAFQAEATLAGSLARASLNASVQGPARAELQADLRDLSTQARWQGRLRVESVQAAALDPQWPPVLVRGELHSQGTVQAFTVRVQLQGEHPQIGAVAMEADLEQDRGHWRIPQLGLRHPGSGAELSATGQWRPGEGPGELELSGQWRDAGWPLQGEPAVSSARGSFQIRADAQGYRYELEGVAAGTGLPPAELALRGQGDGRGVRLEQMTARLLNGVVRVQGEAGWEPQPWWRMELALQGLDPGLHWPQWPGHLGGRARLQGALAEGEPPGLDLHVEGLQGELRGYPVSLAGRLRGSAERWMLEGVRAASGSARLRVDGSAGERWALRWQASAPDLSSVLPEARGSLRAQGRLLGARETPRLVATAEADQVWVAGLALERLNAQVDAGLAPGQALSLDLAASGLGLGEAFRAGRVQLVASGAASGHTASLSVSSAQGQVDLAWSGELEPGPAYRGRLTQAGIEESGARSWSLEDAAGFRLGARGAGLDELCLREAGGARLCAHGTGEQTGAWRARLRASALPLAWARPWLPPELSPRGVVDLSLGLDRGAAGRWQGEAELILEPSVVELSLLDEERELGYGAGRLAAGLDARGLRAQMELPFTAGGGIEGSVALPGWSPSLGLAQGQALSGTVRMSLPTLALVDGLVPEVERLDGAIRSDLSLGGSLGAPLINGQASLSGGRLEIPRLGLRLEDVSLSLTGTPERDAVELEGSARSGPGSLRVSGRSALQPAAGWPTVVRLTGEDLQVIDVPEAWVLASPDLRLRAQGRRLGIEGTVFVPRARLRPDKLPEGTVAPSSDVVLVGPEAATKPEPGWELDAQVTLALGEQVSFDGFGLRGRLSGRVTLVQEPGRIALGRGELGIVDGVYRAYGQDLSIERGRLLFASTPVDNPGLDMRAARRSGDVLAGVRVSGTLKDPELALYSEPSMAQADALSYLLLGRPVGQASQSQGQSLMLAATALGLSGGDMLARQIGSRLGLEEIRVESGASAESASLVLGKYLSPRLYVRYVTGLFEESNVVVVRYDLNRHVQIQSETGTSSGADVFYTLERE